jgi:hypothetical protein
VDDGERTIEIERLSKALSEATARRAALLPELQDFAAMLPQIRRAFGNPFSYSRPEHADESVTNYSGFNSHDVVLPTILGLRRVDHEIQKIREQLRRLGISAA